MREWQPRFVPTWLVLRVKKNGTEAEVIRKHPGEALRANEARVMEAWENDVRIASASEFRVGQRVSLVESLSSKED